MLFDAVSERLEAERLAALDEGVDERCRFPGRGHAGNEGGIDLEPVDGEVPQVRERAVAGAEIVAGCGLTALAAAATRLASVIDAHVWRGRFGQQSGLLGLVEPDVFVTR